MFDLSITKILILAVLGLMIFGPEQLPRMAAQAGKALRDLRRMAENARSDLTESLGPEFKDFDDVDYHATSSHHQRRRLRQSRVTGRAAHAAGATAPSP